MDVLTEFPETQASLLAQIQTLEDREAWEQFVSIYRPVIYRIARKRGLQEADAQDLTQVVLQSIANSIHRWQQQSSATRFRHWLRRVVKNAIINALTRHQHLVAKGGTWTDDELLVGTSDEKSEHEIDLEYKREVFKRAATIVRHDIDPETWQAFQLTVVENVSIESASMTLGKSTGSIYAAKSRVMKRLKNAVDQLTKHDEESK